MSFHCFHEKEVLDDEFVENKFRESFYFPKQKKKMMIVPTQVLHNCALVLTIKYHILLKKVGIVTENCSRIFLLFHSNNICAGIACK